jgi:hypothetical protein
MDVNGSWIACTMESQRIMEINVQMVNILIIGRILRGQVNEYS